MDILFVSVHSVLDRASGAAISVKTQLEELAKLGWDCRTVTGTVNSGHLPFDESYSTLGVRRVGQAHQSVLLGVTLRGVNHLIVPMHNARRSHITSDDEQRYFEVVREQLRDRRPDVLYVYGKRLLERAILREARQQGIATAFYLANASYHEADAFEDADAIFTPSHALAQFYANLLNLKTQTIGSFTRPLPQPSKPGEAILFVNPEPGKGMCFLIEIARTCLTELPEAHFLVVESRETRETSARQFNVDWKQLPNVRFLPQQPDLDAAFAAARVLLFPALSFDAAPRIIVEANHAGLPVLSSAHGGSPEMLDGAGFLIDVPSRYRKATTMLPDSEAVRPWVEHLKLLWLDEAAYTEARSRAAAASSRHDLPALAERFNRRLELLVGK